VSAALALGVAAALLHAVLGGLLRAGWSLPGALPAVLLGRAAVDHAALMICAFMGTVIAIERAVALKLRFAWLAPGFSAAAGIALLAGAREAGAMLLVAAAIVFVAVNIALVRKQSAWHTWLLLASAVGWLAGNALFAAGAAPQAMLQAWFAFLLMTIAAERLEMTRLMRQQPGARAALAWLLALLGASCAVSTWSSYGGIMFAAALAGLAVWFLQFDIARKTVRTQGLAQYMAVCLLGGYAWLAVAAVAWAGWTLGAPWRDAALHALGLGFVFSMMLGHAPVVLPAVARIKLLFGPVFYVPWLVLNVSLALRVLFSMKAAGAALNALALVVFAATVLGSALAWRTRHPT
jgi:hypothetical protein